MYCICFNIFDEIFKTFLNVDFDHKNRNALNVNIKLEAFPMVNSFVNGGLKV